MMSAFEAKPVLNCGRVGVNSVWTRDPTFRKLSGGGPTGAMVQPPLVNFESSRPASAPKARKFSVEARPALMNSHPEKPRRLVPAGGAQALVGEMKKAEGDDV